MPLKRVPFKITVVAALALALTGMATAKKKPAKPIGTMDESKRALHALNRLTFGPRPGDSERVEQMGVENWIELQLHPERIDDSALDMRLAPLRTLKMDTRELVEDFPPPQVIKAVAEGRQPMPSDPTRRAIYQEAVARYLARSVQRNGAADSDNGNALTPNAPGDFKQRDARMYAELQAGDLLDLPPEQRYHQILKMSPEDRASLEQSLKPPERQQMLADMSPQDKETLIALTNPQQVVVRELSEGKILRAAYSERQLDEVMTDFWFNHFNVFIGKGPDHYLITSYERDVIRPRAMGKFKDLLLATAQSPAMLFYLDNWQSVGPDSAVALGIFPREFRGGMRRRMPQRPANANQQRRGLNENYAREIMELHTLGVDGGYTQKDVTELAKILTGWTIKQPAQGGGFEFNERMHEPGDKVFLGHTFHEGGENEGSKAIGMLASSPATAKFISRKLAMRFVSDDPSPALVDRMAQTFLKKDGDIREVLHTLFLSPEFWAADDYRAKVKTPLEFAASALRATGADVNDATPVVQTLNRMGMPLYGMQPPTGYSMKAATWVNSSALLDRMNFSLALANGRVRGINVDPNALMGSTPPNDPEAALAALEKVLLNGDVSPQTHAVLEKQLQDPKITGRKLDDAMRPPNYGVIAGLILGSPEFQKR